METGKIKSLAGFYKSIHIPLSMIEMILGRLHCLIKKRRIILHYFHRVVWRNSLDVFVLTCLRTHLQNTENVEFGG